MMPWLLFVPRGFGCEEILKLASGTITDYRLMTKQRNPFVCNQTILF